MRAFDGVGRFLLPIALAAAATPVLAQTEPGSNPDIVVTGNLNEVRRVVHAVLSTSGPGHQIARFEGPVCPGVAGLPDTYATTIIDIIRANALQAGVKLAPEGCAPNAVASFVPDPQAFVRGLWQRDRTLFGILTETQVEALAARTDPVISWRATETRGRDGSALQAVSALDLSGLPSYADPGVVMTGPVYITGSGNASRIEMPLRQDIRMAFAAIDRDLIKGKSLQQLGDLATMHLLLDIAPGAGTVAGPTSILSLLYPASPGSAPPVSLSATDRGMLGGLYQQARNYFNAARQRTAMTEAIRKELEGN
jgi:hypothetical protein